MPVRNPQSLKRVGSGNSGKPLAAHYGLPDEQIHPAIREAWHQGNVRDIPGKLELTQIDMLAQLERLPANQWKMILAGRKIGKTWLACVLMLEHCLRTPNARVVYLAPVAKNIKEAIIEIMEELLVNCPLSCSPAWLTADRAFRFPNGALIRVLGVSNNRSKSQRGPKATMLVLDECSFTDNLTGIVKSVLGPMTLRSPDAVKLMLTSAPDQPGHDVLQFIADHRARGTIIERTIYDRKGGTDAEQTRIDRELAQAIEDCGGADTIHFKREYCNALIFDSESTVIPEWQDRDLVLGKGAVGGKPNGTGLIREVPYPESFHAIVGFDPGFSHHAGVVFCYVDFEKGWLVVVDELDRVRMVSSDLAPLIRAKELELWGTDHRPVQTRRVIDNDPSSQGEMKKEGLLFAGIGKKDLRGYVNSLRKLVKQGNLIIHPRCKRTIACLYKAQWKARHNEDSELKFREDGDLGHFDLLAALIYANARAPFSENPFPEEKGWSPYAKRDAGPLGAFNTAVGRYQKPSEQVKGMQDSFAENLK